MTLIKNKIGRAPQNLGEFDPKRTKGYDTTNRCYLYGCEWESLVERNTYPPAKIVGGKIVADTEHWRLACGNPELYGEAVAVITPDEIDELLSD